MAGTVTLSVDPTHRLSSYAFVIEQFLVIPRRVNHNLAPLSSELIRTGANREVALRRFATSRGAPPRCAAARPIRATPRAIPAVSSDDSLRRDRWSGWSGARGSSRAETPSVSMMYTLG